LVNDGAFQAARSFAVQGAPFAFFGRWIMLTTDELFEGRIIGKGVSWPEPMAGLVAELAREERRPFSHVVQILVSEALVGRGLVVDSEAEDEDTEAT